jgi:hypothetical protein
MKTVVYLFLISFLYCQRPNIVTITFNVIVSRVSSLDGPTRQFWQDQRLIKTTFDRSPERSPGAVLTVVIHFEQTFIKNSFQNWNPRRPLLMLCNKEDTWTISVVLTEAYLHIPMHPSAWIFLRFVVRSRVYEFRALPFDLFPTPYLCSHLLHVFTGDATNMTQPIKGWLCVGVHGQILTKIVPLT